MSFGTRAAANARTSDAPWRMTPARSCRLPGMNPGVSTTAISGSPNASQNRTNRAAFSELSASSTPPR